MVVAIPGTLIRLVSQYLCPFKTPTLINELSRYKAATKFLTHNVAFYVIDNRLKTPHKSLSKYIRKNIKSLLMILLNDYDAYKFDIMYYLVNKCCTNEKIIDTHHIVYNINFNLNDYIILQGCIRKNVLFLNDFIKSNGKFGRHEFHSRSSYYRYRYNDPLMRKFLITVRDIVEYLLLIEDIDSVRFVIKYFGVENDPYTKQIMRQHSENHFHENLSKTLEYLKEW